MGISKFLFSLLLFNMGFFHQALVTSSSEVPSTFTYNQEFSEYSRETSISKYKKRISETVCEIYKRKYPPRIFVMFGGEDAKPGSFPHMGALGWRSKFLTQWVFKCGSSLISARFLVTAAHCSWLSLRSHFDVVRNAPEIVRLGVENIIDENEDSKTPTDKNIKRIIKHPNYKPPKKYFDISLIELEDDVIFSADLHPACLWTQPGLFDNDSKLILSGWGLTEDGKPSPHLQVASVDELSTELCDDLLLKFRNRNWYGCADHQMCAGKLTGEVDTCQGDSGGPLQTKFRYTSLYNIIGVTSFGVGCGKENQPGLYTRIYHFVDWIEEVVWKDGY